MAHAAGALALVLLAMAGASAQDTPAPPLEPQDAAAPRVTIADPDLVQRYIDGLREMRAALADYRWRARAEIRVDDRTWLVEWFDARLDGDGRLQRTLVGHEVEDPSRDGPLRRRVQPLAPPARPGAAPTPDLLPTDEQAVALKRLGESYAHPDPADVRRVPLLPAPLIRLQPLQPLAPATPTAEERPPAGRTSAAGPSFTLYDVIREGDSTEVWLDEVDERLVRLEARTDLDGRGVTVSAQYSRLPDGTPYLAHMAVRSVVEAHPVEVGIDAFDFDKRRPGN